MCDINSPASKLHHPRWWSSACTCLDSSTTLASKGPTFPCWCRSSMVATSDACSWGGMWWSAVWSGMTHSMTTTPNTNCFQCSYRILELFQRHMSRVGSQLCPIVRVVGVFSIMGCTCFPYKACCCPTTPHTVLVRAAFAGCSLEVVGLQVAAVALPCLLATALLVPQPECGVGNVVYELYEEYCYTHRCLCIFVFMCHCSIVMSYIQFAILPFVFCSCPFSTPPALLHSHTTLHPTPPCTSWRMPSTAPSSCIDSCSLVIRDWLLVICSCSLVLSVRSVAWSLRASCSCSWLLRCFVTAVPSVPSA